VTGYDRLLGGPTHQATAFGGGVLTRVDLKSYHESGIEKEIQDAINLRRRDLSDFERSSQFLIRLINHCSFYPLFFLKGSLSCFGSPFILPIFLVFAKIMYMKKSNNKKIVVAVSGYFNPIHVGHLEMIREAKKLGDHLVVIVNSDHQVKLKGSVPFMPEADRVKIMEAIKWVDEVFLSIDKDGTVCESLKAVRPHIFGNGGDRNKKNVPEDKVCAELGIKMVYNLGKKIRSSSILIKKAVGKVRSANDEVRMTKCEFIK